MAPEQALGSTEPDARSDIYALGGVAYFLLTGRPPFEGSKPLKVVIAHAHDPVTPPSHWQPGVSRFGIDHLEASEGTTRCFANR